MNLESVSLSLAAIETPLPKVDKTKDWVLWGANHGFQKEVLGYIRKSPTASAMLSRKAAFIAGEGFNVGQGQEALRKWLENVASTSDKLKMRPCSGNSLLQRLGLDAAKLEAYAIQVGWAKGAKPVLAWLKHQRIETVASGPLNDEGEVTHYWICRDWNKQNEFKPVKIPAYNPAKHTEGTQLLVYYAESPGQEYYPDLSYAAALPYMQAEARLATYHDNNIRTRFALGAIVKIRKGPEDFTDENGNVITAKAQREAYVKNFKATLEGENGERLLFIFGQGTEEDAADKMAHVEPFSAANGETYETVAALAQQGILSAGQVTSPTVVGLPGTGGLGGNASEIREAYEMYNNTVCRPWQVALLETFRELAQYAPGVGVLEDTPDSPALEIISSTPVKFRFSEDTVAQVLTDDEIRAANDFAPGKKASTEDRKEIEAMLTALAEGKTTRVSCVARLVNLYGMEQTVAEAIVPDFSQPV